MRDAITFGDILLLTRYVLRFAPRYRAEKCCELLARICDARVYVEITGQPHPLYGDGSISALALRFGVARLAANLNSDVLQAFATVLSEISTFVCVSRPD